MYIRLHKQQSTHARSKQTRSATGNRTFTRSAQQSELDTSQTHWGSPGLGGYPLACVGLSWLALACLSSAWKPVPEKTFRGLKSFFLPPRLLYNLIRRQNKCSSPGMVGYSALSSVWKACTWKNCSGPNKFFFPSPPLQPDTMPK